MAEDKILKKVSENRRGFLKRVLGTSFAAPVIASFSMASLTVDSAKAVQASNQTHLTTTTCLTPSSSASRNCRLRAGDVVQSRRSLPVFRERTTIPMSGIQVSAALIVKNEEDFLEGCLASLQGIAGEVVIVDTGSTDRTKQVAERGGARVYDFAWSGDFSAARNYGLEQCRGEWILYIDADERVRPGSAAHLAEELSSANHIAYQVLLHPCAGFTPFWILRLFRNDPAIRFRGVIHENLWPTVQEYRATRWRGSRLQRADSRP